MGTKQGARLSNSVSGWKQFLSVNIFFENDCQETEKIQFYLDIQWLCVLLDNCVIFQNFMGAGFHKTASPLSCCKIRDQNEDIFVSYISKCYAMISEAKKHKSRLSWSCAVSWTIYYSSCQKSRIKFLSVLRVLNIFSKLFWSSW